MKKILLVLAMVAASAFMAQPAIAADDVPTTQDSGQTATDPPVIPPVVVPPVVVDPPVVPPVVVPPVVVPPVVDPPATDPPAADPPAADPTAADPPAADSTAPAAKSFNTPEICPPTLKGLNNYDCDPTCDQNSPYTKGKYCHPQCDENRSQGLQGNYCPPQCDDKWSPNTKFKSNDDCHPRCDDKWKPSSSKFKGGDRCHHPRCDDHKHGKKHSRSDELSRSSFSHDKKGHGKHSSHCPRPPKCETHDKKHDHKSWGEHSDDKPSFKNMKYEFPGGDWSHSGKRDWDKKHKDHKDHCSTPKEPSNPSDPGSTSGVLPDTGGAPLWVLMMGGLITAAGVTVLVRRSPAVPPSDSAGGGR